LCYNQLRAGCKLIVYFFLFLSLLPLRVWIFASCESHKLQHHFTTLSTRRSRVLASHWVLVQYGLDQHHIEFWSKMVRTRYDEARKHKFILHAKRRRKIVWNSKHGSKSSVCSWREKSSHWSGDWWLHTIQWQRIIVLQLARVCYFIQSSSFSLYEVWIYVSLPHRT
jgi:hypothetical protein